MAAPSGHERQHQRTTARLDFPMGGADHFSIGRHAALRRCLWLVLCWCARRGSAPCNLRLAPICAEAGWMSPPSAASSPTGRSWSRSATTRPRRIWSMARYWSALPADRGPGGRLCPCALPSSNTIAVGDFPEASVGTVPPRLSVRLRTFQYWIALSPNGRTQRWRPMTNGTSPRHSKRQYRCIFASICGPRCGRRVRVDDDWSQRRTLRPGDQRLALYRVRKGKPFAAVAFSRTTADRRSR